MIKEIEPYNVGDLVEFKYGRLGMAVTKVGIVVEQSLNYTKDNLYKIKVKEEDYWIRSSHITLLSKAPKAVSK
tara:strand:+ start:752 stop:970 length:219 start_codon:yes stop_codon:yes gene_type:complete